MPKTSNKHIQKTTEQRQGRDYVHGDHAAIKRMVAVFASESGVSSDWHETPLTARLGGRGSVDNACPGDFDKDAEPFLELTNEDGETLKVNLACLLGALTGEILEALEATRCIKRLEKKDAA